MASYFFYGWFSYKFLGLLALSTFIDYLYGFQVASVNRSKAKLFLWLSIINNLGILAVFKYYNFFAEQFQHTLGVLGIHTSPFLISVMLPVGISFYTFHGMSYVFDIYRQKQMPVKSFTDYAVFVSFFPLLVAGPIERANHLLPQVQKERKFNYRQAVEGCKLIVWGMFKKIAIADNLATVVDAAFKDYTHLHAITLIISAIIFSFQIYCDFSGYSDIALGTAKLFGFELLSNFRFPYFSRDIAEFWRRWHISLSSWFRDYLYIPLGGSKGGKAKAIRNTFIIFLVSGFWHGASWHFIAWGFIHACGFLPLLILDRNRKHISDVVAQDTILPTFKELWQMILTFSFVTVAWIFFRADSMGLAIGYIRQVITTVTKNPTAYNSVTGCATTFAYILPLVFIDWRLRRDERIYSFPTWALVILSVISLLFMISHYGREMKFIYFEF